MRRRQPAPGRDVLVALTVVGVGLQIAYPLTRSPLREHLTVAIVVTFAVICVAQAGVSRGAGRALAVLAVTAGPGFLVEILGVHTGFPFGTYRYSHVFGPHVLDVPLVIALAWTMMLWPAALAARRLVAGRVARVGLAAWATTAADLFLDPQMVTTGAWTWHSPGLHLPGVPDVPLTNYAGWFAVTLVLSALVQAVMGDGPDGLGLGLYVWSWLAWTVALAVFLRQPAAALWGVVAMGTVAVPVLVDGVGRLRGTRRPACGDEPVTSVHNGAATWVAPPHRGEEVSMKSRHTSGSTPL